MLSTCINLISNYNSEDKEILFDVRQISLDFYSVFYFQIEIDSLQRFVTFIQTVLKINATVCINVLTGYIMRTIFLFYFLETLILLTLILVKISLLNFKVTNSPFSNTSVTTHKDHFIKTHFRKFFSDCFIPQSLSNHLLW